MEKAIKTVQYSAFVLAQMNNSLLLYLLVTKASRSFGAYRSLMMMFSLYAMVYSMIEVLTFPVMFCKGRSLCIASDGPLTFQRWIGVPLTAVYCGSFGMCTSLLAIQFIYRYIAVCRPEKLYIFEGNRVNYVIIPCFLIWAAWVTPTYILMQPSPLSENFYHDVLLNFYKTDSYKVSFIVMMYMLPDGEWNISHLLAFALICSIMSMGFNTISYCGLQTYRQMQKSTTHMSKKTKELNRQLFLTLGMQTLLPLITMYVPVTALIFLPLFGVEVGRIANYVGAIVVLYPALDPLIAVLLIKDFRNYILCRKSKATAANATSGVSTLDRSIGTTVKK